MAQFIKNQHIAHLVCHKLLPEVVAALDDDGEQLPVLEVAVRAGVAHAPHLLLPRLLEHRGRRVVGVAREDGPRRLQALAQTPTDVAGRDEHRLPAIRQGNSNC